jgi:hypothetical protein
MTAIGTTWRTTLVSGQRGPVGRRSASNRKIAFALARALLDQAEQRSDWHRGEVISIEVRQAEDP